MTTSASGAAQTTLAKRELGRGGPSLNPIGLGCMGLSAFYGAPTPEPEAAKLVHRAIELGVDHFDTAEMYGGNEEMLGRVLEGKRDQIFLATKFGIVVGDDGARAPSGDGSEANMRRAIEQSLRRLKTDHVNLYYLHRPDKNRPIEETVGAMAKLVEEGKVRAIGLSEASSENIRRGAKVHPIAAIQTEYSIFTRDIEAHVLPAIEEVGASLVAYSPLGRGMLTGAYRGGLNLGEGDFRAGGSAPRFEGEALEANNALVAEIEKVATEKGVAPGQVALAWVLGKVPTAHVIPGTTKIKNLESNLGAAGVVLSADDFAKLEGLAARVQGARYNAFGMAMLETD